MRVQLKRLLTIAMSALLVLSLAACAQDTTQLLTPGNMENGETVSVNIGESVDFASYDPIGIEDGQGLYHYSPLVYETLVRFENGEAAASLAEAWESEGSSWVFRLRKNITFTDGQPFNAEAVKLNIEKLHEFQMEQISYYGGISRISSIETPDEYTVVFHYETPYYPVLQDLSAIPFGMMSPSVFENGSDPYGNTLGDTAGTGMYELKKENCTPGKSYTFTRNTGYWGTASGPDSFTVKIIPDADSRLMAIQTGEIDVLYGSYQVTYDMFDQLSDTPGLEAKISDTLYATRNLLLNTASKALGDIRVRQAIQHGINKQQIIDTILHGNEGKADHLFSRALPFCDVDTVIYEYDIQKAESLLDEAGWNKKNANGIRTQNGSPLTLTVIYMSERSADEQILTAFKGQMAEIGIDIQIKGYETMTWFEKGLAGEFDISVNDTYAFPQDPYVFIAAMTDYGVDNPAQQGLSQKAEIDARIFDMLSTIDEAKIQEDFTYILTTLQEEAVNVPVSYLKELCVYNAEKIQSVSFDINGAFLDVSKIVLK
ncbi:MAG TPA: ABC transporter substrate-binding protein [Syntrophomonas sp.]|nr:ABC transporter substrate-binding protein [Syntrophomonas sp.]